MERERINIKTNMLKGQMLANTLVPIIDNLVIPFLALLITPLFLKKLGAGDFGLWLFLSSVGSLMSAFNSGIGDATVKFLSEQSASLENLQAQQQHWRLIFQRSLVLAVMMISAVLLITLMVLPWLPWEQWFKLEETTHSSLKILIVITIFQFGLKQCESMLLSPWRAQLRYDIASAFSGTHKFFNYGIQVFLLTQLQNIQVLLLGSLAVTACFIFLEFMISFIAFPYLWRPFHFRLKQAQHLFHFSAHTFLQSMVGVFAGQFDRILVIFLSGSPQLFSYYSVGAQITGQIHQVFVAGSSWAFPLFSRDLADHKKLEQLFSKCLLLIATLGLPIYIFLVFFGPPLFSLWLGPEHFAHSQIFIKGFLAYGALLLMTIPGHYLLSGTGKVSTASQFVITASVVNFIFIILGYWLFKNPGLVWGRILAFSLIVPVQMMILFKYVLHHQQPLKRTLLTLAPIFLLILTAYLPSTAWKYPLWGLLAFWILWRARKLIFFFGD